MIPTFKTLQSTTQESMGYLIDTVQANVSQVVNQMNKIGLTDTTIINGVSVSTSDTVVNHNLGRKHNGWWVVGKNAACDVFESSSNNPSPTTSIILRATSSATISLIFF